MAVGDKLWHPKRARQGNPANDIGANRVASDYHRKVEAGILPAPHVPMAGDTIEAAGEQLWFPMADMPPRFTANFMAWLISIGDMEQGDVGRNNQFTVMRSADQLWRLSRPPILMRGGRESKLQFPSIKTLKLVDPSFFEGLSLSFPNGGPVARHVAYCGNRELAKDLGQPRSEPSTRAAMQEYYENALKSLDQDDSDVLLRSIPC